MAGRGRSFIAASTMQKFLLSPGLRYSTSVTQTPALPTSERPGSTISLRSPKPRASMRCEQLRHSASAPGGVVAVVVDAQAAAEVDVAKRMPARLDRLDQVEHAVQRVEVGRGRR